MKTSGNSPIESRPKKTPEVLKLREAFKKQNEAINELQRQIINNEIIEIVEIGDPKSIIHREDEPITELIETVDLVEELNSQFKRHKAEVKALNEIMDGMNIVMKLMKPVYEYHQERNKDV